MRSIMIAITVSIAAATVIDIVPAEAQAKKEKVCKIEGRPAKMVCK
jgi:hypothetical protein